MAGNLNRELIEVGYFLSRLGVDKPPQALKATSWKEAYSKFYSSFGISKTEEGFRNSLKNLRDHFDSHIDNSRVGWMNEAGYPQELSQINQQVFDDLERLDEKKLWKKIQPYAVTSYNSKLAKSKNNEVNENGLKFFSSEFSGTTIFSGREEGFATVEHGMIVDHLKDWGEERFPNQVIYNTQKVDLAIEISGTLEHIFEVKTSLDTQSIYTAVGQLFMHTAGNNNLLKWIVLPEVGCKNELIECFKLLGLRILLFKVIDGVAKFKVINH
ncbi:hypothetical protein MK852_10755 [Shewanella benthica]|nr:hypothetical protein [Shewanella benthica]